MNVILVIVILCLVVGLFVSAFIYSKKIDSAIKLVDTTNRIADEFEAKKKSEAAHIASMNQEELREALNKRNRPIGS